MAQIINTTLKSYFQTGDIPTQGNYVDLIDSKASMNPETNSGSLHITNTFSGSKININGSGSFDYIKTTGDVSSSGTITGATVTVSTGSFDYVNSGSFEYIKVVGTVSSSGLIISDEFAFGNGSKPAVKLSASVGFAFYDGTIDTIHLGRGGDSSVVLQGSMKLTNITASGTISSSGGDVIATTGTGSFSRVNASVINATDYFLNNTQILNHDGTDLHVGVPSNGVTDLELEGFEIRVDAGQDIILDAAGADIYMKSSSTTVYTFNLDGTPELDIVGDFVIDPSGGDVTFSDSNVKVEGNITSSGHISASGTGDHKLGGDLIVAGTITASNGLLFTNNSTATITSNENLTLNFERTNDLNPTIFKVHNLTTGVDIFQIADTEVFTFGSADAALSSKGNMTFMIDSDDNETGQKYAFKNYSTVLMELTESGSYGTLEVTGTVSSSADIVANNKVTAATASFNYIKALNLPTSDPEIEGVIWNDAGKLKISLGS
jgi:hypothetical protein